MNAYQIIGFQYWGMYNYKLSYVSLRINNAFNKEVKENNIER